MPKELLHRSQVLECDATESPCGSEFPDFKKPCQGLDNFFGMYFAGSEDDLRQKNYSMKICQERFSKNKFFSKTALP
jgi:hypothetical protein